MIFHVILPGYNCEGKASRSIESVLAQDVDFRLTVVDDGSEDGTWEEVIQYKDPRITLLHNEVNRGASYSRWRAIQYMQYDDDDVFTELGLDGDVFLPGAFSEIKRRYGDGADFTYGSWAFDEPGRVPWPQSPYSDEEIRHQLYRKVAWHLVPPRTCLARYLRPLHEGLFLDRMGRYYMACTDSALWFPLIEQARRHEYISKTLCLYHDEVGTSSRYRWGALKQMWRREIRSRPVFNPMSYAD